MTIKTIAYGVVPFVAVSELDPDHDECIDFLEMDDVEIWRKAGGRIVAVDCLANEDYEPDEPVDLEVDFDPYAGCYIFD